MKKHFKFYSLVLIIILLSMTMFTGHSYPVQAKTTPYKTQNSENVEKFASGISEFYPFLIDMAKEYNNMLIISSVYKALLSGKLKTNFGGGELPNGIDPKFYNSIPISGSLKPEEMSSYGPYTSCDWIYVTLNWSPSDSPLTIVIYDDTAHTVIASRTSTNNSIAVWSSLVESHYYSVFVFNDSSRYTESYYGKITLSQK